ncbi:hypothetical protein N1851_013772 [Merluccius polli]|uniref:Uncharacterized protein n=1 Tax=Merluccius polli TaxID=89951 RepID=A0AA47MVG8_MERPO|nr:hypothetical protein N1851_013772 [Merluccius polli]
MQVDRTFMTFSMVKPEWSVPSSASSVSSSSARPRASRVGELGLKGRLSSLGTTCRARTSFHCAMSWATNIRTHGFDAATEKQPFVEGDMYVHLRGHLRRKEMVPCPFRSCKFKTNVYSTYNAHKCREHQNASDYDVAVVVQNVSNVSQDSDIEDDPVELPDENEAAQQQAVALRD